MTWQYNGYYIWSYLGNLDLEKQRYIKIIQRYCYNVQTDCGSWTLKNNIMALQQDVYQYIMLIWGTLLGKQRYLIALLGLYI